MNERRRAAFLARLARAESCPVPGPCGACSTRVPHSCELGRRLGAGSSPATALASLLGDLGLWRSRPRTVPDPIVELVLERSCRRHRAIALRALERARRVLERHPRGSR